jgi:hypothetical protein
MMLYRLARSRSRWEYSAKLKMLSEGSTLRLRLLRHKMIFVGKYFQISYFSWYRKYFTVFTTRMENQFFFEYFHLIIVTYKILKY